MPPKKAIAKKQIKLKVKSSPPVRKGLLEIEFSGLCALVLNHRSPKRATEARVLLVAGERALGFTQDQIEQEGRRWSARLCVPRTNLDQASAADETLETYGGDQIAVWHLDGPSAITVENDSGDPLVVSSGKRKAKGNNWKNAAPSPHEPPEDISWLPEMGRVVPGAGKLKAGLWDGWGGPKGPLSGKVILTSGFIEANQPSQRYYAFQDENKVQNTDYIQRFANGIRVRIWLRDHKAKIRLTGPDRILELIESPEYLPIRLTITNHSGTSEREHTVLGDPHFKAFYALSQAGHSTKAEKRLFPVELDSGQVHSKVRPCMGVGLYE